MKRVVWCVFANMACGSSGGPEGEGLRDAVTEWNCSEDASGSGSCTDGFDTLTW
jgi:hypothetical protein